jgi:hypothetical protein
MTISLLLGLLAIGQAAPARQTVEPSSPLQAKAEAIRAVTCVADSDFLRVDVDVRMLLSNRSDRALIVPAGQTVLRYRTAPKPEDLPTAERGSITTMLGRSSEARGRPPVSEAPDSRFLILRPGEVRELAVHAKFLVFAKDVFEAISAEVSTGAVYDMTPREWREAERKWRSAGELLTESIRSGGFMLPITAEAARQPCGEQLANSRLQPTAAGAIMTRRG